MKAAVVTENHQIITKEYPLPDIGKEEVLLKVLSCGVCGTDVGKVKFGLTTSPTVLGHEVAGEVVKKGDLVDRFQVGDRVVVAHHTPCYTCHYCRHENFSMCKVFKSSNLDPGGFAEYLRIPSAHVRLTAHKIPENLSYSQAIFMEPLACVLRNIKRSKVVAGDTALVIGMGTMGLLTGQALRAQGIKVIGSDLRQDRRELGQKLSFEATVSGEPSEVLNSVKKLTDQRGVDCVILTSGNERVYSDSIAYVRDGGCISIFAGLAPGKRLDLDVNELYRREIILFSSYSPSPLELIEALEYLAEGKVEVNILAPKIFNLDQLGEAINAAAAQEVLKAIIEPHSVSL